VKKKMPIVKYGDGVLREKAVPVAEVTEELRDLAEAMIRTMHAAEGVGLAAEQVGRTEAVCVIDVPEKYDRDEEGLRLNPDAEMPMVLFNPVVTRASKATESMPEGCLSFPEISGSVRRPRTVEVKYLGADNEEKTIELTGYVARAAQHEIDHLNGILFVDRFSHVKKIAVKNKLRRLAEETRGGAEAPAGE